MKPTGEQRRGCFSIVLGVCVGAICGALVLLAVFGASPGRILETVRVAAQAEDDDRRAAAGIALIGDVAMVLIGGLGGSLLGGWVAHRLARGANATTESE